ncbi:MAG: hypothetical protein DRN54_04115, partial [Thaumarchaeota archaeon]
MSDIYLLGAKIKKRKKGDITLERLENLILRPSKDFYLLPFIASFPRIGMLKSRRTKSGKIRSR